MFVGRHFDREVIVQCVRWYLRFKLSYRDLVEMWPSVVSPSPTPLSCAKCGVIFLSLSGVESVFSPGRAFLAGRRVTGQFAR